MDKRIFRISLTAALAGFLFGFDTVVISGANQPIKEIWQTNWFLGDSIFTFHGIFIMSMALWGTVLGSLFGGIPTDRLGRKKTLFWIGILYFASAVGSAFAPEPYSFSLFRFIGGIGVGASSVAAPVYISEISTAQTRGRLTAMYQFNIVFGILIAFISNYLIGIIFDESIAWRWMLGIEGLPALIYTLMVFKIPNSPRWLLMKNRADAIVMESITLLGIAKDRASIHLEEIKIALVETTEKQRDSLFSGKYNKPLMLAFLIAFFNQLSGINFVLYYAPEILERAGLASGESLFSSISIGVINLIFTFVGISLIDKLGRKQLMYIGSIGYIISLAMVGWCFYSGASSVLLLTFILIFIASHAVGQGAVIWVFISEIFPNKVRSYGQSWGTGTHWVFAALITLLTPTFLDAEIGIFKDNPWPIFIFFAGMMVLQLLWVIFMMPETKGISLEELGKLLSRKSERSK
ncbi:MAG: sugar porter family MFS transporter [Allomuricauda sp.]|jgi:sugar porter (SP) family MFS transporter|nr:sugar porter family MFS transporter [Allomuricauda sp.]MBO6532468.1 sugar porter family MFS transporter [Allomuricauda sp.]MBO6589961.1 sugar porter family MFS transporter [Allomuricauda sp.]MBO6619587.1 sugar porter family MFS transporter [Allomuricauda sp.]MBO6645444.1 sugar porter family MFS transporter [Allomuricauda sp.]MBO6747651.1 sugar porter family MFS transporter [Allomuricauda sp.]